MSISRKEAIRLQIEALQLELASSDMLSPRKPPTPVVRPPASVKRPKMSVGRVVRNHDQVEDDSREFEEDVITEFEEEVITGFEEEELSKRYDGPMAPRIHRTDVDENHPPSGAVPGGCCSLPADHSKQKIVGGENGTAVEARTRTMTGGCDRGNEGVVRGNEGGRDRGNGDVRGNAEAPVRENCTSHEVSTHSHAPSMGTTAPSMGTGTQLLYAPTWAEDFDSFVVGKAPGTIRKYKRHFNFLVRTLQEHTLYNTHPNDITTRQLKVLALSAKEQSSSSDVARDRIGFIMNFWNFLYTEEKVDRDRGTVLKKLKPKKEPTQMVERNLTREECELMYTTAKRLGAYDTALFSCAYAAGQRRFEVAKLCATNCTYNDDKTINLRFKGKGDKVRTVPLSSDASRDIEPFLKAAMTESGQANGKWLFPGVTKGQHISNDTVYNHIVKLGKLSGLEEKYGCKITPHWLRHGFGSHAIQAGADPATVSKQMGHASIDTTSGYTHATKATGSAASDYLQFTTEEEPTEGKKKKKKKKKKKNNHETRQMTREEYKQWYRQLKQKGADDEMVAQAKASYKSFPKH